MEYSTIKYNSYKRTKENQQLRIARLFSFSVKTVEGVVQCETLADFICYNNNGRNSSCLTCWLPHRGKAQITASPRGQCSK